MCQVSFFEDSLVFVGKSECDAVEMVVEIVEISCSHPRGVNIVNDFIFQLFYDYVRFLKISKI